MRHGKVKDGKVDFKSEIQMLDDLLNGKGRGCPHEERYKRWYEISVRRKPAAAIWCWRCGERIDGQYTIDYASQYKNERPTKRKHSKDGEQPCLL